jgi:hypothetical protein
VEEFDEEPGKIADDVEFPEVNIYTHKKKFEDTFVFHIRVNVGKMCFFSFFGKALRAPLPKKQ